MTAAQPAADDPPEAPTDEDASESKSLTEGSEQADAGSSVQPVADRSVSVPNVDAYFDYQAVEALRASGFQPNVVYEHRQGYIPKGVVWGPDPAIGTETPAGSTVTVYATPVDQPQVPTQGIQGLPVLPQGPIQPQTPQARFPI